MNLTFSNIYNPGSIEKDALEFTHLAFTEVLELYDGNFIKWKVMPTLEALQKVENYLKEIHLARGQNHSKFVFPQDEKIPETLQQYLIEQEYGISFLEMYAIKPNHFSADEKGAVQIEFVTEETLPAFCEIHYEEAKQWGETYALSKRDMLKKDFYDNRKQQIIARMGDEIVGSVEIIVSNETAEIDSLFVLPTYQRQGIGSKIQKFVMELYKDKVVILVADGEDTPKDMYVKQGYHYIGFQYNALKLNID